MREIHLAWIAKNGKASEGAMLLALTGAKVCRELERVARLQA